MTQAQVRKLFIDNKPGVKRVGYKGRWYKCADCGKWCGRSAGEKANIPDKDKMEVDHKVPWSHGGSDTLHNLQPLCMPCNRSKSAKRSDHGIATPILHPIDTFVSTPLRKAARQNPILKGLGITKRK